MAKQLKFTFKDKKTVEEAELKKEKAKSEKGLRYMQAYMVQANKQLQERK